MVRHRHVQLPQLVRIKPGALTRLGVYLSRLELSRVEVMLDAGVPGEVTSALDQSLTDRVVRAGGQALLAVGGGRTMDEAKLAARARGLPWLAVPTALSQDGFASPFVTAVENGVRRAVHASMPLGVVIDTNVCAAAPRSLWLAGLGDLCAKFSAVLDWKLAFHATGEPVDDLAALLSDATVHQVLARPTFDESGLRLLGTALFLNGVAMELAGSSRPASGSEHLLSHALDQLLPERRPHGLQVAFTSLLALELQARTRPLRRDGGDPERFGAQARNALETVVALGESSGLWTACAEQAWPLATVLEAARLAPTLRPEHYTVLSSRDVTPELEARMHDSPTLRRLVR